jgi:hypothetical protein
MTIEETGTIVDMFPSLQEGNLPNFTADDDDESSDATSASSEPGGPDIEELPPAVLDVDEEESPLVVDDSVDLRRSARTNKGKGASKLTFSLFQRDRDWQENAAFGVDLALAQACSADVREVDVPGCDPTPFMPAPDNIRTILRMMDEGIRIAWIKAYRKELKVLIDSGTFSIEDLLPGEFCVPTMETNRVKLKSDGTLEKLKCRIVVRGDLQNKQSNEDKWSPTASFRALKMFLGHAARLKVRVRQLDFIGAFLQAKVRSRVFVKLPAVYGEIFPEFKEYCGRPLRLLKSMYGMTFSGKYWYLDLQEWLLSDGFTQSEVIKCLFFKTFEDGSQIFLLDYVDDMLYYGTDESKLREFEDALSARFDLEKMGQAHWYLSTRITQHSNFDVTIDQSRYCLSLVKKYLDSAGCKNNSRYHATPLPIDFVPTSEDNSKSEEDMLKLQSEFKLDFASCVGALIYLALTRVDISHAVNKLAKYTRLPGDNHYHALFHVLRYLRDHPYYGITFYGELSDAPIYKMLKSIDLETKAPFLMMSDSSWNDDVDTGRSTGMFEGFYQGGCVDHSSNMPDPIALSTAESEYNQSCLACMAADHLTMLLAEIDRRFTYPISLFLDSKSAIAMGNSFKDTKHTRHIMRRYHFVRAAVAAKRYELKWITTEFQLADIGTKQLAGPRLALLRDIILTKVPQANIQEG